MGKPDKVTTDPTVSGDDVDLASKPEGFSKEWKDEDDKDGQYKRSSAQIGDETGSLGSMTEDTADVDEMADSVGLRNDDKGPRELNMLEDLRKNEEEEWET